MKAGCTYAEISWSNFSGAQEYHVYLRPAGGGNWEPVLTTALTGTQLKDLELGIAYDVRVRSDNNLETVEHVVTKAAPTPTRNTKRYTVRNDTTAQHDTFRKRPVFGNDRYQRKDIQQVIFESSATKRNESALGYFGERHRNRRLQFG